MKVCKFEVCEKKVTARGFCSKHYQRHRKHGDPSVVKARSSPAQDFYRDVVLTWEKEEECLIWPHSRSPSGYAQLRMDGQLRDVHLWACEDRHGPKPSPRHNVAHACGRGRGGCVNPAHLRWATRVENEADKIEHGTSNRGKNNGQAKLTEAEVREIRSLEGQMLLREIGALFSIERSTVCGIIKRRSWAWLLDEPEEEPPATKPEVPYLQDVPS